MSDVNQPSPEDYTPEQISMGLNKFVSMVEEEIALHHQNPEWMDYDQRCVTEKNLIIRAELVLDLLEDAIGIFQIPDDDDNVMRIKTARNYFTKL
ncbi:MAG: hypothetical protein HOM01_02420 [Kordiimonadaceae bacterium]|jgi:hypothetical protein|nr:hypothetical protein [Kordiimonadaceae bacterium]